MAGMQGRRITLEQSNRVRFLLAETELTTYQIAVRMGTSKSTIIAINRRYNIRRYNGKRTRWEPGSDAGQRSTETPSILVWR